MSLSTADDVISDIENVQSRFSETAKKASHRVNVIQKTIVKELIIEATIPKYSLEMDNSTKFLALIMEVAESVIINRITNTEKGSEGLYNTLIPEYASIYACRLVDLMNGSQAVLFLEECLKYGVYKAIRSWDLNPTTAESSLYQNTPSDYIRHITAKSVKRMSY